jgi:N-acetylmuramoyl-L-alanine amidase
MSHLSDIVKRITLTTKADESRDLAEHLQATMVRRLKAHNKGLKNLGVKRAPFVVLIGASMPSVLVEVAFLTHEREGRLIASPAYRQRIADSLLAGMSAYLTSLKKVSPVVLERSPGRTAAPMRAEAERRQDSR